MGAEMISFWHWWVLSALLLLAEMLLPGVVFLWLSLGAAAAGLAALAFPMLGWEICGIIMVAAAAVSAVAGRKFYDPRRQPGNDPNLNRRDRRLIGKETVLETPIAAGIGRARIGGTLWSVTGPDLPAGTAIRVTGITDSMVLEVEKV